MTAAAPTDRPDFYVLLRFLERLHHEEGQPAPEWTRSRLQRAARVNYDIFRRYLDLLHARGLVETVASPRSGPTVRITEKGRAFYRKSLDWLDSVFDRPGP